jgi:hypothetical protein
MVQRRILDIIPPRETGEPTSGPSRFFIKAKIERGFPKKPLICAACALFAAVLLGYFLIEPKAEIKIWPVTEQAQFQKRIEMNGEIFKVQKIISEEFPATGTAMKEEKARGVIRIYNEYSASPQVLIANTRFVSSDGKLFRTPARVVVPAAPGAIDIEVAADQPGEEYNIGPTSFSIPGFAGTSKYTAFYAKSSESMAGGMRREVAQVTKEDFNKAKDKVTQKALDDCKASLIDSAPKDYFLIKDAPDCELAESLSSTQAGKESDKFIFQAKAEGEILAFSKAKLTEMAKEYFQSQIPLGKELNPGSFKVEYGFKAVGSSRTAAVLDVNISGEFFSPINQESLKNTVLGKEISQIKPLLEGFSGITNSRVELWPFLARSMPVDPERINIGLVLD